MGDHHAPTRSVYWRGTPHPSRGHPSFGPGFTVAQVADAYALEVWVTRFQNVADTTVWRLVREGTVIAVSEVGGF